MPESQTTQQMSATRKLLFIGVSTKQQLDIQNRLSGFNYEFTFCRTATEGIELLKTLTTPCYEAFIIDETLLENDDFIVFQNYQNELLTHL